MRQDPPSTSEFLVVSCWFLVLGEAKTSSENLKRRPTLNDGGGVPSSKTRFGRARYIVPLRDAAKCYGGGWLVLFLEAVDFGLEAGGAEAAGGLLGHGHYVRKVGTPAALFLGAGHGASAA